MADDGTKGLGPLGRYVILDADLLRCHEETVPDILMKIREELARDGYLRKPILVSEKEYVILDGHHRFQALVDLGCRRIPAFVIDYYSDVVHVETWPEAVVKRVTKDEVIRRGKSGDLFPPKTSRHILRVPVDDKPTSLKELL